MIVNVFKHEQQEEEPSLEATINYPEQPSSDVRGPSGARGAPRVASNGKHRFTHTTSQKKKHAKQVWIQRSLERCWKNFSKLSMMIVE
jgi:hypothetical protein